GRGPGAPGGQRRPAFSKGGAPCRRGAGRKRRPRPGSSRAAPPAAASIGCRCRSRRRKRSPPRGSRRRPPPPGRASPPSSGREAGEVVDAQLLLDGGDLLDRLLEPLLPEQAVFLFLELLAE